MPDYLTFYLDYKEYFTFVDDEDLSTTRSKMTFKTRKMMIHLFPKMFNKSELFPKKNGFGRQGSYPSDMSDSIDLGESQSEVNLINYSDRNSLSKTMK